MHAKSGDAYYSIARLCRSFGVSKQAYYKRDDDRLLQQAAQAAFVVKFIKEKRTLSPGIGGRKLWYMYQNVFAQNNPVGRDRFESIVDLYGLKVRKKSRKPRTTDSSHGLPTYPDLTKSFIPDKINQLWVSDITYIPIREEGENCAFCYLSLIMDAYSEEIVGWSVGDSLETVYPLMALDMALKRLGNEPDSERTLIHHSDRGVQYASKKYINLLQNYGIKVSMTESGNPKDNAKAERINNTMKNELLKDMVFKTMLEVKNAVSAAVKFYNEERPHMSIDMMTPIEAAACQGEINKRWVSYREALIKQREVCQTA